MILAGPPDHTRPEQIGDAEWQELKDGEILKLLEPLEVVEPSISEAAATRLSELHDRLGRRSDSAEILRPDFPFDEEAHVASLLQSFQGLSSEEEADRLRSIAQQSPSLANALLGQRLAQDIERTVAVLRLQQASGEPFLIDSMLNHLSLNRPAQEHAGLLVEIINSFVSEIGTDGIISAARVLSGIVETNPDIASDAAFWTAWDSLTLRAVAVRVLANEDKVLIAINHPLGVQAESLLFALGRRSADDKQLPEHFCRRAEKLLELSGPVGDLVATVLCSRLAYLFFQDPDWTIQSIVPCLSWEKPGRAVAAWQGFLWQARLSPTLWNAIRLDFLEALDRLSDLDEYTRNAATILADASILAAETLPHHELRRGLRLLTDELRAVVAWRYRDHLDGAEERRAALFRDAIAPRLMSAWPTEDALKGPHASRALAELAVSTGSAFEEAVGIVQRFLVPVSEGGFLILKRAAKNKVWEVSSSALLELLTRLIPPRDPHAQYWSLKDVLERTDQFDSKASRDPRYRSLYLLAVQRNWLLAADDDDEEPGS